LFFKNSKHVLLKKYAYSYKREKYSFSQVRVGFRKDTIQKNQIYLKYAGDW